MTDDLTRDPFPLRGRTVLVTGVSRRAGIGYAVACRAAAYGANVFIHHFAPHDAEQPWGGDDLQAVINGVQNQLRPGAQVEDYHADLAESDAPARLVATAAARFGRIDALVCNQALSGADGTLAQVTPTELDRHWAVNTRASLLLAQAFAEQFEDHGTRSETAATKPDYTGAIVFLTSGQNLGPMPGEIAYAAAKAALSGITRTIAHELAPSQIRVNTVNPGPVDTGYHTSAAREELTSLFPFGRLGEPDDPARLITWLLTDEAAWITGQVLHSEGGFKR